MDSYNFDKARKQLIAKRNDMIQKSRFSLSLVENKAILYILSKVQPNDKPGKLYDFNCDEFYQIMNWSKDTYTDVKAMLTRISESRWWIDDGENEALVTWFHIVHMNKGTGNIQLSFHDDMVPFILDLQRQRELNGVYYTTYQLESVALMKHLYSERIYELLKSYQYNNMEWIFEIGTGTKKDLQVLITASDKDGVPIIPAGWHNFGVFNRDVLKPAKEEINKYTDIKIEYEGLKVDRSGNKHRRYCAVKFYMLEKTRTEKEMAEKIIEAEYTEIENEKKYQQMSIEELFLNQHKEALQIEQEREQEEFEKQKEDRLNNSKYPVLTSCIYEYTDEEIENLYIEAAKHLEPGRIEFRNKELWVTDYITHYNDFLRATKGDTKTTPYKRLFDMVRKDYDDYAASITEYDKIKDQADANYTAVSPTETMSFEEAEKQLKMLQEYMANLVKKGK